MTIDKIIKLIIRKDIYINNIIPFLSNYYLNDNEKDEYLKLKFKKLIQNLLKKKYTLISDNIVEFRNKELAYYKINGKKIYYGPDKYFDDEYINFEKSYDNTIINIHLHKKTMDKYLKYLKILSVIDNIKIYIYGNEIYIKVFHYFKDRENIIDYIFKYLI
jgi:hypothetical protein